MNVLPREKRKQIIALLVEGNSIRGTARVLDITYNAVLRFICKVGPVFAQYQDITCRNLPCRRLEVDEVWSFCHTKRHNVAPEKQEQLGYGDLWTFTAFDPDTKLIPAWLVGKRTLENATKFMIDLSGRLANRVELSTDGFKAYLQAVETIFGNGIDYGMLVKIYEDDTDPETLRLHQEPGIKAHRILGNPTHTSTSGVERHKLTMRQSMRRFMRRTTGFSKKVENHSHSVALHCMYYNFCRIHSSIRVTPAMAAGVSKHVWEIEELLDLLTNFTVA